MRIELREGDDFLENAVGAGHQMGTTRMDDDPARFHTTITFDEQSDGKCVLTMRQLHPTKEQRDATIGFGAVEFGYQTLDKLARYLGVG